MQKVLEDYIRMCYDGFLQGWHERNGGNLTYRMKAEEAEDEARPEAAWDTSTLRVTRFPEDALFPCAWTATPEELTACS